MFGYVKPYTPEMKIIENQYYQAAYCGLCRAMKKEGGTISRLTLSYDVTFLVLARLAITGEIPEFYKKRCFAHPFKKKLVMKPNRALIYSSHAGTLLTGHKIGDDIADEKGMKKLGAMFMKMFFASSYKKASRGYAELDEKIRSRLGDLRKLEREKMRSADRPAALFGELMADIMTYGIEDEEKKLVASSLGCALGRWIYLIDALDDIEDDRRKKSYNPFLLLFDDAVLDGEKKLDVEAAMLLVLKKALAALDLIDFEGRSDLEGLMRNVISVGLPRITHQILFESGKI